MKQQVIPSARGTSRAWSDQTRDLGTQVVDRRLRMVGHSGRRAPSGRGPKPLGESESIDSEACCPYSPMVLRRDAPYGGSNAEDLKENAGLSQRRGPLISNVRQEVLAVRIGVQQQFPSREGWQEFVGKRGGKGKNRIRDLGGIVGAMALPFFTRRIGGLLWRGCGRRSCGTAARGCGLVLEAQQSREMAAASRTRH